MKKSIYFLLFFLLVISNSKAYSQNDLCDSICTPSIKKWVTIPLCQVYNYPTFDAAGNAIIVPFVNTVFVEIAYRVQICNNITSFIIEDYVFVDDRNYLISIDPWFASNIPSSPCLYALPPSVNGIKTAIADAIQIFLEKNGNPAQSNFDIYFKGACNSLVLLSFPDSSFFTSLPNDLGIVDTFFVNSNCIVTQSIPCMDVCCKVTYNWQVIILSNGESISKWVPIGFEGNEELCGPPIMLYDSFPDKLTAQKYDPLTGKVISVFGNKIGQEDCSLICKNIVVPAPPDFTASIKSDISNKEFNFELSAVPMPFNNYLKISSNKAISKLVVFDGEGNKKMEICKSVEWELNTSELNQGIYFIQVYFSSTTAKTIKVIKY